MELSLNIGMFLDYSAWSKSMDQFYNNSQWRVTRQGLEAKKPEKYQIFADQLDSRAARGEGGTDIYDFPIHLAEKEWVDLNLFLSAFRHALDHHGHAVDEEFFDSSAKMAFAERKQLLSYH